MGEETENIKAIFWEALDIADEAERRAYLQEVCGEDNDTRGQVDELIKAHEQAHGFLESYVSGSDATH